MKVNSFFIALVIVNLLTAGSLKAEILAKSVKADLSAFNKEESLWKNAKEEVVTLMMQPMVAPRPKVTTTEKIKVQAIHDGNWLVFRIRWADPRRDDAGKLGEFSDAAALMFPVKEGPPPPIFMGAKDNPVHIYHWRAQYQYDEEHGKKEMKDIYPNMSIDMYPMEFKDPGKVKGLTKEKREQYVQGQAAGNPQSYAKHAVDEIFAEGFGTSAVIENVESYGKGVWKNGEWTLILGRHMSRKNGSSLSVGKDTHLGFAIWQGSHDEVGSRKTVTMSWTPMKIEK
ncbi:MAG: ethylbenzene dehydrogenase-related protein [Oligoflexia bacterium]|nr:ethylbenzene dehydrogenase-related protein [Oligoflexia bacterium]